MNNSLPNHLLPNHILPENDHLTNERLDDVLLGDASHPVLAHYESCHECRARGAEMMSAIQSFKAVTMEWSERRSATLPAQPVTDGSPWGHKLNWALAAAVLVVGVVVLPLVTRSSPGSAKVAVANQAQASAPQTGSSSAATQVVASTTSPAVPTPVVYTAQPSQIARDNRLLQTIDEELDASVASPAETFGVQSPQGGGRARQNELPGALWN